jgi:hypothetical protein
MASTPLQKMQKYIDTLYVQSIGYGEDYKENKASYYQKFLRIQRAIDAGKSADQTLEKLINHADGELEQHRRRVDRGAPIFSAGIIPLGK